jgi:hypothetical protein
LNDPTMHVYPIITQIMQSEFILILFIV